MAHKNLIDGTAYEIDGGKAMVDGAVYEIDHGVANVDGTAYEVGFGKPVKVTVTAKSYMIYARMTVNGVSYHLPDLNGKKEVLTIPIGAEIFFTNTGTRVNGDVYINHADGTQTTGSFSKNGGTYGYKVIGYAIIEADYTSKSYAPSSYDNAPVITITEIPEGPITFTIKENSSGTKTYQAEGGMTWGEWVDSEYSPLSYEDYFNPTKIYYVGRDDLIFNREHNLNVMVSNDWTYPGPTDFILPNAAYKLTKD